MSQRYLSINEINKAVKILTDYLKQNNVTFGIIGGAGCSLLFQKHNQQFRGTQDIDVIIQADPARQIDAFRFSETLYTKHPQHFAKIEKFRGFFVPAVRIKGDNGQEKLVEVEIFDSGSWPDRSQYDLSKPDNDRVTLNVEQTRVEVLSPRWLLREKILSQHERSKTLKAESDALDVQVLLGLVGPKCLTFNRREHVEALKALLEKYPDMRDDLEAAIECPQVF